MGLKSIKERLANRLSISSAGSGPLNLAGPSTAPLTQVPPANPPAYEDVPVFANPAAPDNLPYLPIEILTEIIYWAVTPAFDEYRQHESAVHVTTLRNLANVSTTFLDIVRRVCRESDEINEEQSTILVGDASNVDRESIRMLETASVWMPISVMAGIFRLKFFDVERKTGKPIAKIQSVQPRMLALMFVIWDRQAMEKVEGVPRNNIYLPFPVPFARLVYQRGIDDFNVVLKALAHCHNLKFAYVRLSVPVLKCDANLLLAAVKTIAPTRYLEINLMILGWSGEEHPRIPGFSAKLPLEILQAGLSRGASRVDLYNFRLDDQHNRTRELYHDGSLVNFIRARNIPDGVVTAPGSTVFSQLSIGGSLDFSNIASSSRVSPSLSISDFRDRRSSKARESIGMGKGNKVIISGFMYSLTAVIDGQLEWMGDGDKFSASHFLELALRDGEGLGTQERRRREREWQEAVRN